MRRAVVALAVLVAAGAGVADAHHVESRPSDARLAELYPKMVRPGFKWGALRERWTRTHPAAVAEHVIPYEAEFSCINRFEASGNWDTNTGNGYYGGLQMDRNFMAAYGGHLLRSKGTADRWTREEQIRAAARAVPGRGFHPWPQTARMCGLL